MITLKSPREIKMMWKSGQILAGVHRGLHKLIKPGIDTWDIEEFANHYIREHGAFPSQIGFDGYKYATCISINNEVAHGIPRKGLKLKDDDVCKVDMCVNYKGFESDSCWCYGVGKCSKTVDKLMKVCHDGMYKGIEKAQPGNRLGDVGHACQHYIEDVNHMGDVKELIGHGIQPSIHEKPDVPAYGTPGQGLLIRPGMTFTVEPMVILGGTWHIKEHYVKKDDWTYYMSADGTKSAQYEATLAITKNGPWLLTSQDHKYDRKFMPTWVKDAD